MPRDIGTSTGVNETVGAPWRRRRGGSAAISGVCRCPPPTPYALAEPISSEPSRCGLSDAAGAGGSAGGDDDDVVAVDQPAGDRGQQGQRGRGRVAAGHGDPPGAGEHARADRAARAARTARCRRAASRRTAPRPPGRSAGSPRRSRRPAVVGAERLGDRGRGAVRQRQEDDVVAGQRLGRRSPRRPGRPAG